MITQRRHPDWIKVRAPVSKQYFQTKELLRELKLHTALAALTAWGIADRTEPLGKRLSRAELDILVKETGLDQQLKLLGYWPAWQRRARGRKP